MKGKIYSSNIKVLPIVKLSNVFTRVEYDTPTFECLKILFQQFYSGSTDDTIQNFKNYRFL